jgi:hypothetical protein
MRSFISGLALSVLTLASTAQDFAWIKGSQQVGQAGAYGTKGVPGAGMNPGGRHGAASWKDANGNYWIFGGDGMDAIAKSRRTLRHVEV